MESLTFEDAVRRLDAAPLSPVPALVETIRALGANNAAYFRNNIEGGLELQQIPEELETAFGWLPHTTRGFLSILGKTRAIEVTKGDDGIRTYRPAS